jgi:hypothetical protein
MAQYCAMMAAIIYNVSIALRINNDHHEKNTTTDYDRLADMRF